MNLSFSIIIPVYNRPNELDELLNSLTQQNFQDAFEVIVVEDGSTDSSEEIVKTYQNQLHSRYFFKENSGAGASRNYGMQQASGNYFIILDSDVLAPPQYLLEVKKSLETTYTDAYGGPDAAHSDFSSLQQAINYSMTSILTTGGIRGKKKSVGKFQPRSFNMGLSKTAFSVTQGFSKMKVGEDIDLTFRLWQHGFKTQLIESAFVYHKRRSTLSQFYKQTFAFGIARPVLSKNYPQTAKLTYWFPSMFVVGLVLAVMLAFLGYWQCMVVYALYFTAIFIDAYQQTKSFNVAVLTQLTTLVQFLGYGLGFLRSKLDLKH